MVEVQQMRAIAGQLRERAQQITREARTTNYSSPDLDAGLLNEAADHIERSAAEIDRLRELISGWWSRATRNGIEKTYEL